MLEEFVWPGGFKAWWRIYRPGTAGNVSDRYLIGINALLIAISLVVAIAVSHARGNGVAAWLTLAALLFSNAIFHVVGAFETKRYSPGMVTGLLLYGPLAGIGYAHFLRDGRASPGTAVLAALLGGSYHFIAFANHRRRARLA
ncbi:MAG: HXXEE domain-containing protein [Verrucomicrobiota bacterium]|nr:HXXEE domain-containing protein [Verrucomicrobiota bacterium]